MAISIRKYVDVTSGVGGGAGVKARELIGRIVTQNALLPPGTFVEFTSLTDVGAFFGTNSEEYARATAYFSFISKLITKAQKLSFVRWNTAATAPVIVSNGAVKDLTAIKALTAANLKISTSLGGNLLNVGPVNFSAAADLTAVASLLQTAIRAAGDPQLTTATVTYNTGSQLFTVTGSVAGSGQLTIAAGATNDCAALLGFLTGQTSTPGMAAQSAVQAIDNSANASDNFGSFAFIPVLAPADVTAVAAWTHAQNNKFMFCHRVLSSDTGTVFNTLKGYSGVAVTLYNPANGDFPEQCPMEILAAINYNRQAASQNFMFYQFGTRVATVTDTPTSDTLDNARVNYIGQTQTAGQKLEFYQRGVLMGDATAATDMSTFANEMWLKDYILTQFMSQLLSLGRIPANESGRALAITTLQTCADLAKLNGTISVGKPLNNTQKAYIGQVTGDPQAWFQVQTLGYWLDADLVSFVTTDGRTEWKIDYQFIYSKDDQVRKVTGSDILI